MRRPNKVVVLFFLLSASSFLQGEKQSKLFSWYGFISPEYAYDSRRMIESRDYHYILYPANVDLTRDKCDANAVPRVSFTPFNARLGLQIQDTTGIFGTRSLTGALEADFRGWGVNSALFRLRKALLSFEQDRHVLFFGQTVHPFAAPTTFPNTVSYGKGDPYDSAVFVPQAGVRYFYHGVDCETDQLALTCWSATMGARSPGPDEMSSCSYMREGVFPGFNLCMQGFVKEILVGASVDVRPLRPASKGQVVASGDQYYESSTFGTYAISAYAEARFPRGVCKVHGAYNNGYADLYSYGGYVVKTCNEKTGVRTYTPLRVVLGWFDAEYEITEAVKPGLFMGVGKNYGAGSSVYREYISADKLYKSPIVYGVGYDIDRLFRIAPRIWVECESVKVGVEAEWNRAWYGTLDSKARVVSTHPIDSVRLLMALLYTF